MTRFLIQGLKVYTETKVLKQGGVLIEDGKIQEIFTHDQLQKFCEKNTYHFPANHHLVPGFIDLHIHGANGSDVMDNSIDALQNICINLPKEGTTSFLATTLSQPKAKIEEVLQTIRRASDLKGAEILGVHLEGPFLSFEKPGAHEPSYFLDPDIILFNKWQTLSGDKIKIVTVAPEKKNGIEFIQYLKKKNVTASIGHSYASYEKAIEAIEAGSTYATHLFNAMTPIHQRNPGCSIACLLHNHISAEIIADGVHLHGAMIHLTYQVKGPDLVLLVTDAMRAKCMPEGEYTLGDKAVIVNKEMAALKDGTIAGSILKMDQAFRNVYKYLNCPIEHMIKMCSTNPAKIARVFDRKGSITKGKEADLVILNENLEPILTLCKGEAIFEKAT
ncbi:MAG: N-acetylglucosamine-6-phosphate deacetylase [Chlamydiae bacterium CG10_big_fil_rev_8_21_14_0_10_35_9]|nr:MAG: N-acetylglucosamine-6-phosphate deacetylase [Chlamydiae bacterium CG10_big_fil_rev_8_21_14_0_10_35_9]